MAADPATYARVFDLTTDGQEVFADLSRLFAGAPFVAGQPDVTAYRCGAKAVIEHIAAMINAASPAPHGRTTTTTGAPDA